MKLFMSFFLFIGVLGQCNSQSEAFLLDKLCGEIFGFVDTNAIAAQLVCGKQHTLIHESNATPRVYSPASYWQA